MFRTLGKLIFFGLLLVAAWLVWALLLPTKPDQTQILLFPPGSSSKSIAQTLADHGVIRSAHAFQLLHYAQPSRKLKAGEYKFDREATAFQVLNRIARGDIYAHTVVVPEGFNMFDIAQAVEAADLGKADDFLKLAQSETALVHQYDPQAKSLEGYLFPDTYQFTRTQSMHDIVTIMVKRFDREAKSLALAGDIHRLVTMASIIEKETAAPDERPEVASVYFNRLNKHMALDADPTVVYAALLDKRYRGTIYQSDLQAQSAYNTYKNPGLPPGPIANPGRASLMAAMKPAETNYLYFVAAGDGTGHHRFSSTYEEHQRNVVAYRKSAANR
jgi:UPF0755 protein